MLSRSASDTMMTNSTRRESGTESPRITARSVDAGMPSSELRQSARITWSRQAARAASLSEVRLTRAISGDEGRPLTAPWHRSDNQARLLRPIAAFGRNRPPKRSVVGERRHARQALEPVGFEQRE